ncbi:transglutaminase-like cysteine peptidase [Methanomicrobium antiquum]|uniref:Transglutaminase-like cysteine peptidase n=1 Tax=Methanomicrobium antiquum TaxID=487686 RepID=A0AAF0FVY8_9EURY|nr:transglutaminase-like domain-containing protein [Methanomicrobium antiquum]WFN37343.1 transglutaminase-like cysteine peptidase [Methanomicrobium antiquum]
MTKKDRKKDHFFIAYNEKIKRTNKKTGEIETISGDFQHVIINGEEFVDVKDSLIPYKRENFPFSIYDIDFTKIKDSEDLFINGKKENKNLVRHIGIKGKEYIFLNGSYEEFRRFAYSSDKLLKNKKTKNIITIGAVFLVLIATTVIFLFGVGDETAEAALDLGSKISTYAGFSDYTSEEKIKSGYYKKTFSWEFDGRSDKFLWSNAESPRQFSITANISKNSYYQSQKADHLSRNFSEYIYNTHNQEAVEQIAEKIRSSGEKYGYGKYENAMNAASFVQNCIVYASDKETKNSGEYWRYPVETLIDGTGDCEDTAILLAAILDQMDYDVITFGLLGVGENKNEGHVAVAVKDVINPVCGNCALIEFKGENYLYLESTNNWDVGFIPYDYYGKLAIEGAIE